MKKIFGIAPLLLILILGTCSSLQAQIVSVQPIHFEGGFSTLTDLANNGQKENDYNQVQSPGTAYSVVNKKTSESQKANNENEFCVVEYEVRYSIWSYNNHTRTDLHTASYYYKLVSCKQRTKSDTKN